MILILKGADFSASNIGTLSTWRIIRSLGAGATYEGVTSIDKGAAFTATVTIAEGYELSAEGVTVTMGNETLTEQVTISGNIITISITEVTGNVLIRVPTVNINTGEEEEPEIPQVVLDSIIVEYNQGQTTIFESQEIDDLRKYLTVTGYYSDGTNEILTDYTLTGPLTAGISTVTVGKDGKTTIFTVETTGFELPSGYTRYGYIQAKSDSSTTTTAYTNFIYLPMPDHAETLNYEFTIGHKSGLTKFANPGIFGARTAGSTVDKSYNWLGAYWPEGTLNLDFRNTRTSIPMPNSGKYKVVVDNHATSPIEYYIDAEKKAEKTWTEPIDEISGCTMSLFNNIPAGNTAKMAIHFGVRIGDIIIRDANGVCLAYFTPCVNSSKRIGMYDQIAQEFYTSSTASVTTVGNSAVLYTVGNW